MGTVVVNFEPGKTFTKLKNDITDNDNTYSKAQTPHDYGKQTIENWQNLEGYNTRTQSIFETTASQEINTLDIQNDLRPDNCNNTYLILTIPGRACEPGPAESKNKFIQELKLKITFGHIFKSMKASLDALSNQTSWPARVKRLTLKLDHDNTHNPAKPLKALILRQPLIVIIQV